MSSEHPVASLANWRQHPYSTWGFTHVDQLLPVARIAPAGAVPLPRGEALDLSRVDVDGVPAAELLARTHTDAFLVLKDGAVMAETYRNQQAATPHIVFSVSKSITALLAGILVEQGVLDPEAPVLSHVPEARGSAYGDCTLRHLLDMTVSIRFTEDYLDPAGDVARYRVAMGWNPPGQVAAEDGLLAFVTRLPKAAHPHGERFHYVSPNSDMLGIVMARAAGESVASLLSRLLWQPMGMEHEALLTLDRHGAARTAGGICTSLADLARIGEMMRNMGRFNGRRIVPEAWADDIRHRGDPAAWARGDMAALFPQWRYRSKWYVPDPSSQVICAIGIHGQWIYVDDAAGMVAVRQSSQPIPSDEAADHLTLGLFRALARELR